jgi:hypothetical protein
MRRNLASISISIELAFIKLEQDFCIEGIVERIPGERIRLIVPSPSYKMANYLRTPTKEVSWQSRQIEAL